MVIAYASLFQGLKLQAEAKFFGFSLYGEKVVLCFDTRSKALCCKHKVIFIPVNPEAKTM